LFEASDEGERFKGSLDLPHEGKWHPEAMVRARFVITTIILKKSRPALLLAA